MASDDLKRFIDQVSHTSPLRVETDLGKGFVRLRVTEAQRRQAKQDIRCVEDAVIELLRNARDAHARSIFLASSRSGDVRRLVVVDDGCGIPSDMLDMVFEPRVTSKLDSMRMDDWGVHGRGMALYSIRENALSASVSASVEGAGTALSVVFDVSRLSERVDQSTLPPLVRSDDGSWSVGAGPHNIAKTAAEFALANRDQCTVYCGSVNEVAATLYAFGRQTMSKALCDSAPVSSIAPAKRLAFAKDAQEFVERAAELGLELSIRSAYRIMQGSIAPLCPLLDALPVEQPAASKRGRKVDLARDYRGLKVAPDDLADFSESLKAAFAELADRYYLEADVEPVIRVAHDEIQVVFPVQKQ